MSAPVPPTGWTPLGLAYAHPQQRRQLLMQHLPQIPRLFPNALWYFADIQYEADGHLYPAIELAIHQRASPAAEAAIGKWLAAAGQAGAIEQVSRLDSPWLLDPALFPGGSCPGYYPAALQATSARALALLPTMGTAEDLPSLLQHEIVRVYRGLVPARQQLPALRWYQGWLAEAAHRHGAASSERASEKSAETGPGAPVGAWPVVARLCHIQVLRLAGPDACAGFQLELACLGAVLKASAGKFLTPPSSEYKSASGQ